MSILSLFLFVWLKPNLVDDLGDYFYSLSKFEAVIDFSLWYLIYRSKIKSCIRIYLTGSMKSANLTLKLGASIRFRMKRHSRHQWHYNLPVPSIDFKFSLIYWSEKLLHFSLFHWYYSILMSKICREVKYSSY